MFSALAQQENAFFGYSSFMLSLIFTPLMGRRGVPHFFSSYSSSSSFHPFFFHLRAPLVCLLKEEKTADWVVPLPMSWPTTNERSNQTFFFSFFFVSPFFLQMQRSPKRRKETVIILFLLSLSFSFSNQFKGLEATRKTIPQQSNWLGGVETPVDTISLIIVSNCPCSLFRFLFLYRLFFLLSFK